MTAVESCKAKRDKELKTVIIAAFTQNRAVYGTRHLKEVLAKQLVMVIAFGALRYR